MQIIPVSHIDVQSIKRIEKRFRQLAEHQGVSAQQLRLNLMERYVNQWLCKNKLLNIMVCDVDNDFLRRRLKPIPVFVQVTGLITNAGNKSVEFSLPYYEAPYEHCRVISDEPFRPSALINNLNFKAMLKPNKGVPGTLDWQGYIKIFDPDYFNSPLRNKMVEAVKKEITLNVNKALTVHLTCQN